MVEVCLSTGSKHTVGHFKTAGEALAWIEERDEGDEFGGGSYEAVFVKGFSRKKGGK